MSATRHELVEHWVDLLRPLGEVRARTMFGGHGVYLDGVMFALVYQDELYLKTDDETKARFDAAGLPPFVYAKKSGDATSTSYRKAPTAALDDADLLVEWARLGVQASQRTAAAKAVSKPRGGGARKARAKTRG